MEDTLETVGDDIAAAAHRLIIQYGSRAADVARGHARIAEDVDDERVWLDIAEAIDRD
jgi:hypothetical protein